MAPRNMICDAHVHFDAQTSAFHDLDLPADVRAKIFGGNVARLFPDSPHG